MAEYSVPHSRKNSRPKKAAYEYALELLSRQAYSEYNLRKKLAERCENQDEIEQAIARCKELRYLDDESYAQRLGRDLALGRKLSNRAIQQKMHQKGINAQLCEHVLNEIQETGESERDRAKQALFKKYKTLEIPPENRQKAARFLLSRGFDWGIVGDLVLRGNTD